MFNVSLSSESIKLRFDYLNRLVNQPVPWRIQDMLTQRFIGGALDSSNQYGGADAFGAAACFAVGFGLHMDKEKSYDFLKFSAENDNIAGRVLFKTICSCGMVQGSEDRNPNGHFEVILHNIFLQVDPGNPARPTSQMIRNHHKAKDRLAAFCPLSVGEQGIRRPGRRFRGLYISIQRKKSEQSRRGNRTCSGWRCSSKFDRASCQESPNTRRVGN